MILIIRVESCAERYEICIKQIFLMLLTPFFYRIHKIKIKNKVGFFCFWCCFGCLLSFFLLFPMLAIWMMLLILHGILFCSLSLSLTLSFTFSLSHSPLLTYMITIIFYAGWSCCVWFCMFFIFFNDLWDPSIECCIFVLFIYKT